MTTPDPFDDPRYWQEVWHSRGMTNKARHALLHAITAADLSEPLLCFDSTQDSDTIRDWMQQTELKVVGVRHNGFLSGFVTRTQLGTTWLGDDMIRFEDDFAVADTASPAVVIQKLSVLPWLFVRINGQVSGIITKTDLEKPESKLWLHGVLTLFKTDLKVNLLRAYSGTSWFECLSANRKQWLHQEMTRHLELNERTTMLDCLSLKDLLTITNKSAETRQMSGWKNLKSARRISVHLIHLEAALDQNQPITQSNWDGLLTAASISSVD